MIHYIMSRHPAYGRDVVLDLVQEGTIKSLPSNPSLQTFTETMPVDRISQAIRGTLLTFLCLEKEKTPNWPSTTNFLASPLSDEDLRAAATALPDAVLAKPGVQDFYNRIGPLVGKLLLASGSLVGAMITSDPRYKLQSGLSYEEREDLVVRQHRNIGLTVAYHEQFLPPIEMLRSCIEALPRFLHQSINLTEVLDLLIRSLLHVEPRVGDEAEAAIHRFASYEKTVLPLVARLTRFLFASYNPIRDTGPLLGPTTQQDRLITVWVSVLEAWLNGFAEGGGDGSSSDGSKDFRGINIHTLLPDIEAGAFYLLTSIDPNLRSKGLEALRLVPSIYDRLLRSQNSPLSIGSSQKRILHILESTDLTSVSLSDQTLPVIDSEYARLNMWKDMAPEKVLCAIAESTEEIDTNLWRFILPCVIRACIEHAPRVLFLTRDIINASVLRYHPLMSGLAQIQVKAPASSLARSPPPSRNLASSQRPEHIDEGDQWRTWIVVLSAAAVDTSDPRSPVKDHSRLPSDPSSQRDRLSTPRGLLRHLIPFLMAEELRFRSAVIQALGCIHQSAYRILLEDLRSITKHIYDDLKSTQRTKRTRTTDRLYTAVVQVYRLTCHYAKDSRTLDDRDTLDLLLQFVRESKAYLSDQDLQIDGEALRVRRFFFGVVEMVFTGMSSLPDADNLMSVSTRMGLFRLCQEWCAYGLSPAQRRRYDDLLSGANSSTKSPNLRSFENHPEAYKLSRAAAAAMAALCVS